MTPSARPYITIGLLFAACLSAQDFPYVISDRVGDVVDPEERASFGLFPGVAGFRWARFRISQDSSVFALVSFDCGQTYTLRYSLSPQQVDRIRTLIDNRDQVQQMQAEYRDVKPLLRRFWEEVDRTAVTDQPVQLEQEKAESDVPKRSSFFNRYTCGLHGLTAGLAGGGCLASRYGVRLVEPGRREPIEGEVGRFCSAAGVPAYTLVPPVYHVNTAEYLGIACGIGAAGGISGYFVGTLLDKGRAEFPDLRDYTKCCGWWRCCSALPGIVLGAVFSLWSGSTIYGRETESEYRSNADWAVWAPAVLTGLCIAVDLTSIAVLIKEVDDRRRAALDRQGTSLATASGTLTPNAGSRSTPGSNEHQ